MISAGYTYRVLLDAPRPRFGGQTHKIEAYIHTLGGRYMELVDRALYSNSPKSPIWVEYWPEDVLRKPVVIKEVYLYMLEEAWGIWLLRLVN